MTDIKDLIERIVSHLYEVGHGVSPSESYIELLGDAMDALKQYRWIPVGDPPALGAEVLLKTSGGVCEGEYTISGFRDAYSCDGPCCYGGLDNPTHWMPLPPPPESD